MERNKIEMGFDPNVMFREKDGICYAISLDRYEYYAGSGMGSLEIEASVPDISVEEALSNEKITVISYQPDEFDRLLGKLEGDFQDFLDGPFARRIGEIAGESAGQLCMAFARCFRSKKLRHGFVLFLGRDEDDE